MSHTASFIVDGIRSGIGSLGGSLSSIRPDDLLALILKELIRRNPTIDPSAIDDIIIGCANQAGEDNRNVARMSSLLAGFPTTVPAETVNRLCASGMSAIVNAHRAMGCGEGSVMIGGGVESMTRAPYVLSKTSMPFGRDMKLYDSSFGWRFINPALEQMHGCDSMGETAENLAVEHKITREDQDQFAFWSQMKTKLAVASGFYKDELMALEIQISKTDTRSFVSDEFHKPNTELDTLAKLRPAFSKSGSVTAGNASGLNDGAAAVLLADEKSLSSFSLKPKARIVSAAVVGVEPRIMGIGPVQASRLALKRAGLSLENMDIIEINEAFAAQVLACTRSLGLEDRDQRINPNGGAIALGHPLGMTGARIILTAARNLELSNKRYALCTMCIGVGQGYAVILERA
ncbi:MAG TPA: acetyl-CoA C-acyltransferase [Saprospiraceae bacterium]|nr:acetyl-CoA C-acyltransferase [Saprospiraceae bacterium]